MRWEVRTAEGTVGERIRILDAGYWTPTGSSLKDVLFPHATCGFRSRVLNVAAIEVNISILRSSPSYFCL